MKGRIILAAAENGALPGGKAGGVGDVMRDLPVALAGIGWQPTVMTPSYDKLHRLPGASPIVEVDVAFAGDTKRTSIFRVPGPDPRVEHIAVEHPLMSPQGAGLIYCHDESDRPFATDASKFAFFSAAVAAYLCHIDEPPDVLHLHDWHVALVLALRQFGSLSSGLRSIQTVFTIHNLALQGIRPFADDESSLATWFPDLDYQEELLIDPRYADCINPMATAIRLADMLNTVSPSYAHEILQPNDTARGFSGGEGLENDLHDAFEQNRLAGILNGCEYPKRDRRRPGWRRLLDTSSAELAIWRKTSPTKSSIYAAAASRISDFPTRRPENVLVSIGRMSAQKVSLFLQETSAGPSALQKILDDLGNRGVFVMLGSGEKKLEQQIAEIAVHHQNFLLLCGYSDALAELLYKAGDLFLMPSSFEPCGISQMLAMRDGQPCVVHAVGGLKDTVRDGETGFVFSGKTPAEQADNFAAAVRRALHTRNNDADRWMRMRAKAAAERFSWAEAADQYEKILYGRAGC